MVVRKQGAAPLAGGVAPPIPRLDLPNVDGMTMADQARHQQQPQQPVPSIFQPSVHKTQQSFVRPTDMLPEAARHDPGFQDMLGSMFAVNQLPLAMKYGVIRDGKHISPQALMGDEPKSGLSKETVAGLAALSRFNQQRERIESGDAAIEAAALAGPAGAAAQLADPSPTPDAKPITQEDRDQVEKAMKNMDDFDFENLRNFLVKDILNNTQQREIVEARLEPLDLSEIIERGYVTQRVPIVPGKWEPTFQSLTAQDELSLRRLLTQEMKSVEQPNDYFQTKYALMAAVAGLRAVNNHTLPDHRDVNGDFDDERYWAKFNQVQKFAYHMLTSVSVHALYFDIRVRSLFKATKNG